MIEIEEINKEYVLKRLDQLTIFQYYFESKINYKTSYRNPLREDPEAGCKFYINKNSGILYFKDFAWRSFDCFSYIQVKYFLSFQEAIIRIVNDFNLDGNGYANKKEVDTIINRKPAPKKVFSFDIKGWTPELLQYWKNHISWLKKEDLQNYNIFPFYKYYIDGECKYTSYKDIAFLYRLDKHMFQLYAPNKLFDAIKFLTTGTKVFGVKSVDYSKEYIVIAKSYKDFFLMRMLGINCIGVLSETCRLDLDSEFIIQKFKYVFTLFDNDIAGKKASIFYRDSYNTTPLLYKKGEPKDFSDNLLKYGENDVYEEVTGVASDFGIFL